MDERELAAALADACFDGLSAYGQWQVRTGQATADEVVEAEQARRARQGYVMECARRGIQPDVVHRITA